MNHIKKIGCGKVDCHGHGDYAQCGDLYMGEIYICSDCESKQLKQERDAYRDLCVELIEDMKNAIEYQKNGLGSIMFLQVSIDKAEQLIGEKK